ncbi:CBS domain-containing protein [Metallosphaera hakonensis]|uniref:CBS domain-containing protein n=1 Tax=Metallosphaera hakonensis JCM 8857 = DSM 7519 TaxID=1293036 RepID=A0A2U9IT76_9CREN|nr:CBS domain-containing protein [Metallosphaera hakonensis]AWR99172.1 CBS domain-containing protein [Metallosphaera hakonensis JCM 8857 = DSM 7519]
MIKVSDVMSPVVVSVGPDSSMREILDALSRERSGRVLVLRDGKPEAIITTRGIVQAYSKYGRDLMELGAKDLRSERLMSVSVDESVQNVLREMASHDIGGVPVMDGNVIVGMFTERDLVRLMAKMQYSGLVDSIMSTNLVTIDENADSLEASKLMTERKVRRLPIMREGKIVGIVTAADIVKGLTQGAEPKPVLQIGTKNPLVVRRLDTIMKAVKIMDEKRIGTLPVVEDRLVGIITERDLIYASINSI